LEDPDQITGPTFVLEEMPIKPGYPPSSGTTPMVSLLVGPGAPYMCLEENIKWMAEHAEAAQEFNHRCSLGWKCQVEATWTSMYDQDTEVMTTPTSAASSKRKFRAVKESGTADTLGTSSSSSKKSKLNNNKQNYMRKGRFIDRYVLQAFP
jgi:hypothetical protein